MIREYPRDYERSDAAPRLLAALALGTAVFLITTPFILLAIYPRAMNIGGLRSFPPPTAGPRLQIHPQRDLDQSRSIEQQRLETFGWVDRERQITRIPIERAMKLLAERGIPGWGSTQGAQPRGAEAPPH